MNRRELDNLVYRREKATATIQLRSTSRFNALNPELVDDLREVLEEIVPGEDVRCVVLRGSGEAFCAGADLNRLREAESLPTFIDRLAGKFHEALLSLVHLECPLLVGVNAVAAGAGFSLALIGDWVIMDRDASLDFAYGRIGLPGDGGCTYFLPRLVGLRRAQKIALTSGSLDAREAESLGLVTETVPSDAFEDRLRERARALAAGPTAALARSLRLLRESEGPTLKEHLDAERRAMVEAARSGDARRGIEAFFEKRSPEFQGR